MFLQQLPGTSEPRCHNRHLPHGDVVQSSLEIIRDRRLSLTVPLSSSSSSRASTAAFLMTYIQGIETEIQLNYRGCLNIHLENTAGDVPRQNLTSHPQGLGVADLVCG